jgi:hypothetical protein
MAAQNNKRDARAGDGNPDIYAFAIFAFREHERTFEKTDNAEGSHG